MPSSSRVSSESAVALEPKSFYRRPLPEGHVPFSSEEGRQLFRESLAGGGMECWFALSEQYHTQAEPAFCGLGSLVVVLNALEIDPGRVWKGPWRWFSETLLDCCMPLNVVQEQGVTIDELACLARCNGARAQTFRAELADVATLRTAVELATGRPRGPFVVASYSRAALGQTGNGHFSPLAGYHRERDLVLILDVARFKYPPHWVPLEQLWYAMRPVDPATKRSRGWLVFDRGELRPAPVYLRLLAPHGIGDLVRLLLERSPALLAAAPDTAMDAWISGWVANLASERLEKFWEILQAAPETHTLSAEHYATIERLLTELRGSRAFLLIQTALEKARALRAAPDAALLEHPPLGVGSLRTSLIGAELLTLLLLAMPDSVMRGLPARQRGFAHELEADMQGRTLLVQETQALREQLNSLGALRNASHESSSCCSA
ncbi:MAG TPA: phytochelatin synthase family protein [Polyangiaceae bacterium]|nr:phytochelatin synthase family protein [Polyangiaceae bacterium]